MHVLDKVTSKVRASFNPTALAKQLLTLALMSQSTRAVKAGVVGDQLLWHDNKIEASL